jgi:hypothetical protein
MLGKILVGGMRSMEKKGHRAEIIRNKKKKK